nr:hypothetical protein [Brevibacillus laterosporus]
MAGTNLSSPLWLAGGEVHFFGLPLRRYLKLKQRAGSTLFWSENWQNRTDSAFDRKPSLCGRSDPEAFSFNLSYSHHPVAVAFSRYRSLGIDVEHIWRIPDSMKS